MSTNSWGPRGRMLFLLPPGNEPTLYDARYPRDVFYPWIKNKGKSLDHTALGNTFYGQSLLIKAST